MVGSKDTKRKRKESPLPAQKTPASHQQQQQQQANIESSPEVPKRTKVQAQRKFAQGQSAPSTSYSSATVTPSCSNGPNTPANRGEPPIEILPNKRPKTEDFLTFLCFRGTSDLPPHLDFLNQGDTKSNRGNGKKSTTATSTKKSAAAAAAAAAAKVTKNTKQVKKGRIKGGAGKAQAQSPVKNTKSTTTTKTIEAAVEISFETGKPSASKASTVAVTSNQASSTLNERISKKSTDQLQNVDNSKTVLPTIPFAVRKRAEQVPEGNRGAVGRQLRNAKLVTTPTINESEKCNIAQDSIVKRRSNRTITKEAKAIFDDGADDDADDNDYEDEANEKEENIDKKKSGNKSSKADDKLLIESKADLEDARDTTKNVSRATLAKRNNSSKDNLNTVSSTSPSNIKAATPVAIVKEQQSTKRSSKAESQMAKEKETKPPPVKRPRQKESPIFIPSPEPSGRMTRQRAFFEPVKVLHRSEEDDAEENKITSKTPATNDEPKPKLSTEIPADAKNVTKTAMTTETSQNERLSTTKEQRGESDLKVFDFSSDDEQPLAKSIKLKTNTTVGKVSPGKKSTASSGTAVAPAARGSRKAQVKKANDDKKELQDSTATQKKTTNTKDMKNERNFKVHITSDDMEEAAAVAAKTETESTPPEAEDLDRSTNKSKTISTQKRGKAAKDVVSTTTPTTTNSLIVKEEAEKGKASVGTIDPKKTVNARQPRKRTKANDLNQALNGEDGEVLERRVSQSPDVQQIRNQRPSRKTKEAATIYMGIIGHKLQLADDEDDDLSLNSFPDLPNVKEVEKMEIELKKNAVQQAAAAAAAAASTKSSPITTRADSKQTLADTSKSFSKLEESGSTTAAANKPSTVRRGRPPKQAGKTAAAVAASTIAFKGNKRSGASVSPNKKGIEGNKSATGSAPSNKGKDGNSEKLDSDDEDFLLSKEVNVTKRNLAKSFSDSDDEPLAIKVQVKTTGEKDAEKGTIQTSTMSTAQLLQSTSTSTGLISNTFASATTVPPTVAAVQTSASFNMQKLVSTPPPTSMSMAAIGHVNTSPTTAFLQQQQGISSTQHPTASPFKPSEKKSPIPTSKILNVPATYGTPPPTTPVNVAGVMNAANYGKAYIPTQPNAPYHQPLVNVRPVGASAAAAGQMVPVRMPVGALPVGATAAGHQMVPIPPQSPIKYQTPPTTYPPPIEAYPSPKINPNFLTPKFDRMSMPRSNNFPSPSPVKYEAPSPATSTSKVAAATANSTVTATPTVKTPSSSTPTQAMGAAAASSGGGGAGSAAAAVAAATAAVASTSTGANADSAVNIAQLLKDNLMPSKEESGKIFGIASVSLAQSSGPDNTKCTLGKCGSIHKPVLGPVVPTEGYIGDQMSSKERRKAKVNMTHEQIQKWLIECSSNPDEIQDDLDDDFDDNLRPNMYPTTPPPTRDDKESTSFSSSSKATRDLGKSESAWSTKGPSLKATPVVAAVGRKEEKQAPADAVAVNADPTIIGIEDKICVEQTVGPTQKSNSKHMASPSEPIRSTVKDNAENNKIDKETAPKEETSEEKITERTLKSDKDKQQTLKNAKATAAPASTATASANETNQAVRAPSAGGKQGNRKKGGSAAANANSNATAATSINATTATEAKANKNAAPPATLGSQPKTNTAPESSSAGSSTKALKRTPVYNQKAQKQVELKETTTTSHRKSAPFSYGAFSADNEKSVYSFDKDDDDDDDENTSKSKPAFRRQSRRDSQLNEETTTSIPTSRTSPTKKRAAAAAAEKANKDLANASHNSSVSLTLSPAENCKHVKVSLDSEKTKAATSQSTGATATGNGNGSGSGGGKTTKGNTKKSMESTEKRTTTPNERAVKQQQRSTGGGKKDADSDSEGHTFYIPLQGSGTGKDNNGSIQGVAVKLGREGPDGPNQKVIMHATLVTKAQIGAEANSSSKDISKTLENTPTTATGNETPSNKRNQGKASTSAAAAAAAAAGSKSASQTRLKGNTNAASATAAAAAAATTKDETAAATGSSSLVRVNSNSSLLSGSAKSRIGSNANAANNNQSTALKKFKDDTPIKMANNTAFPRHDDPTQMVEAPIFRPTEKEFADPIEFIERITPIAARFGICKIIPPSTFKPECRISDDMRFTAYNQYVHKMLHRWGPSAKELSAIKKYLATQSIVMNHPPWIGGMEVDLPRLYHTVQELGGLKEVIEKKKWARVAEEMCIPKLAQDRVTKLDDIYCKYLLPYDTLSPAERQKLFDEVEADWAKREARARRNADRFVNTESVSNEEDDDTTDDDEESEEEVDGVSMECIVKGRSMALNQFYRIARNTMALWFKNTEPTVNEVEAEFWRHVAVRDSHVCVHSGSIDSSGWGYGFPSPGPKGKGSNYARHPWNLKVLTNNPGSVLRSLGPVMGVTVPTLHVGMLFSACCWYRDPHGLSWIEYLHTGASKLWYGIPDDQSANFRAALTSLIPTHCQNKTIWLPCDTVMVPPHMLTDRGVSLCRIEQRPGEFIVVFPRAYTSSLSTGYVVSESVYFATTSWLDLAKDDFRDIHESCEPAMFSLEQLLFALGHDQRVVSDTLEQMLPMLHEVCEKESAAREQLKAAGVTSTEMVLNEKGSKGKKLMPPFKSVDSECDLCRANLYISMVRTDEGNVYCLQHALKNLNNGNIQAKQCKLIHAYNVDDIEKLIKVLNERIQQKRNSISKKSK